MELDKRFTRTPWSVLGNFVKAELEKDGVKHEGNIGEAYQVDGMPDHEVKANTRLMATAPKMLSILEECLDAIEELQSDGFNGLYATEYGSTKELCLAIERVLMKATQQTVMVRKLVCTNCCNASDFIEVVRTYELWEVNPYGGKLALSDTVKSDGNDRKYRCCDCACEDIRWDLTEEEI